MSKRNTVALELEKRTRAGRPNRRPSCTTRTFIKKWGVERDSQIEAPLIPNAHLSRIRASNGTAYNVHRLTIPIPAWPSTSPFTQIRAYRYGSVTKLTRHLLSKAATSYKAHCPEPSQWLPHHCWTAVYHLVPATHEHTSMSCAKRILQNQPPGALPLVTQGQSFPL